MTGSVALAEDLTQGVFVAILEKISSGTIEQFELREGGLWKGIFSEIARNLARERASQKPIGSLLWRVFLKPPEWKTVSG